MLVQFLKFLMISAIKRDLLLFECCRVILGMTYSRYKTRLKYPVELRDQIIHGRQGLIEFCTLIDVHKYQ